MKGKKKPVIYYGFGDFETSFERDKVAETLTRNGKVNQSDFAKLDCNVYLAGWTVGFNLNECKENYTYANSKKPFLKFIHNYLTDTTLKKSQKKLYFYFHNLNYDFQFIKEELLCDFNDCTIDIIGEELTIYQFKLTHNTTGNEFILFDSQNILRMPLSKFPEVEGLKKRSDLLVQDMSIMRSLDHVASEDEIEYLYYDVLTLAGGVLNLLADDWFMTTSSKAFKEFRKKERALGLQKYHNLTKKGHITTADLKRLNYYNYNSFVDTELHHLTVLKNLESYYKGGFTFVNPDHQEQVLDDVTVIDRTSLYPWALNSCKVPYISNVNSKIKSKGLKFTKGNPIKVGSVESLYSLISDIENIDLKTELDKYFLCITIKMDIKLKEGVRFSPYSNGFTGKVLKAYEYTSDKTRGLKRASIVFKGSDYDLETVSTLYEISNMEVIEYFIFDTIQGDDLLKFRSIVDEWVALKEYYSQDETYDERERSLVKLLLNSLTGKFGEKLRDTDVKVVDGEFVEVESELINSRMLPLILSLISKARLEMTKDALAASDHFVYMDTDSLALIGLSNFQISELFEIHPKKLGAYKIEKTFDKALYMKAKTYVGVSDNKYHFTVAGCKVRSEKYDGYSIDDFLDNDKVIGVKIQKVPGRNGVHLIESDFVFRGDPGVANAKFLKEQHSTVDDIFHDYLCERFATDNFSINDLVNHDEQLLNPRLVVDKEVILSGYSDSIIKGVDI